MASVIQCDTKLTDEYLNQDERPVIVIFCSYFCTACEIYLSRYLNAAVEALDSAYFCFVNVDNEDTQELIERYSVFSVPTTLVFWKGQLLRQLIGIQEKEYLLKIITDIVEDNLKLPQTMTRRVAEQEKTASQKQPPTNTEDT